MTNRQDDSGALRELAAKWREDADRHSWHRAPQEVVDALRQCADELDALSRPAIAPQAYDRELIADMLGEKCYDDGYGMKSHGCYTVEAIKEQMDLLRAADNRDAAGVRTVAAPQATPAAVDDAMVERVWGALPACSVTRGEVHYALTAAIAAPPAEVKP